MTKSPSRSPLKEIDRIIFKATRADCPRTAVASAMASYPQARALVEKQTPKYISDLSKTKREAIKNRHAAAVFRLCLKVAKEKKRGMDAMLDVINRRILTVNPEKKGVSKRNLYRLIERHEKLSARSLEAEIKKIQK